MDKLIEQGKKFHSKKGLEYGQSFTPRPSDVFIATYPKCGTTWVSQICHSLRSGGSLDFEDITQVCPWDVFALDCGQDLDADQEYEPRIFKSHEHWSNIAKSTPSCKYIHVVRDPVDVFVSTFHFFPGWAGVDTKDLDMEEFCDFFFADKRKFGNIGSFYLEWFEAWKEKKDDNILWVFYEDLKDDLEGGIRKIAKFMDIELTEELLATCVHNASFETMSKHKSKFKEKFVFDHIKERLGQSHLEEPGASKVRSGKAGSSKEISKAVVRKIEVLWEETITPELGFKTYSEMRKFFKDSENSQN